MSRNLTIQYQLCVIAILSGTAAVPAFAQDRIAIRNVTVISMDDSGVLDDHTVVVEDGRITQVAPDSRVAIPDGAQVIDGKGKYLIPGLVDMHVHVNWEDSLLQFLVHGVTTVRNMAGFPNHRRWRREIESGERLGPTIFSACRPIDGDTPHRLFPNRVPTVTVEQAEAAVQRAHTEGWQFIKVYDSVSPDVYNTILATAKVPVIGHVPFPVGLESVWAGRQHSIEHLQGYGPWLQPNGPVQVATISEHGRTWPTADVSRMPEAARRTVKADVWNCPTMVLFSQLHTLEDFDAEVQRDPYRYASDRQIQHWRRRTQVMNPSIPIIRASIPMRMALLKALHAAGAQIVAGTDTGMPLVPTGLGLHWELKHFVDAGFSPLEALHSATSRAAECLGTEDFGIIRKGKRARSRAAQREPDRQHRKRLQDRWRDHTRSVEYS